MEPWKSCEHEWGLQENIKEATFGITFASIRVCKKCKAREYDDWTAMRAGSVVTILPPVGEAEKARQ